ncbi:MAG: hypothetical protein WCA35_03680 [Kovacikia sp.]
MTQQLLVEIINNYIGAGYSHTPILYLIQLTLALVYFALWLMLLHYTGTKLWSKE